MKGLELAGKDAPTMPHSLHCYSSTPLLLRLIKWKSQIYLSCVD